jgi:pyruvate-formate lyase-activating enzyme
MTNKQDAMLEREKIANRSKHWVRVVTACNSRCVFCLDMDTPRNVFLPFEEVCADLQRGIDELGADKVILSGGEASLHPRFVELIEFAIGIGYDRVQTVTNGWQYANRDFYRKCIQAGLGEITFSLHGHTPELHDRLTQHNGSFKRLIKSLVRAIRDPHGPIVNVDVVINKQNVSVLDKIVELCVSLGVREFDLLHVIPQSEAFRNREMLFYDVRDHMDVLHKVFRLNRHPGFVIWTNRFPVHYLEGLEDLIQDPHKMLDEVNGRRFQVRRYLDTGETLDCREEERCQHCFIEPFCTSMDRFVERQHQQQFDVWDVGDNIASIPEQLPYGCYRVGVLVKETNDVCSVQTGYPLEVHCKNSDALPNVDRDIRWIAETAEQLDNWLPLLVPNYSIEIRLNKSTAVWMLENRELLTQSLSQISLHQQSYEKLEQVIHNDIENVAGFFEQLRLPIKTSGLPPCIAKYSQLSTPYYRLDPTLFDWSSGRVSIRELARNHIKEGYQVKSVRCRDCVVENKCDGAHINTVRARGLKILQPLISGEWEIEVQKQLENRNPQQFERVSFGRKAEPPAPSLPSFAPPSAPPRDPLAVIAEEKEKKQKERRRLRKIRLGLSEGNNG